MWGFIIIIHLTFLLISSIYSIFAISQKGCYPFTLRLHILRHSMLIRRSSIRMASWSRDNIDNIYSGLYDSSFWNDGLRFF